MKLVIVSMKSPMPPSYSWPPALAAASDPVAGLPARRDGDLGCGRRPVGARSQARLRLPGQVATRQRDSVPVDGSGGFTYTATSSSESRRPSGRRGALAASRSRWATTSSSPRCSSAWTRRTVYAQEVRGTIDATRRSRRVRRTDHASRRRAIRIAATHRWIRPGSRRHQRPA